MPILTPQYVFIAIILIIKVKFCVRGSSQAGRRMKLAPADRLKFLP